MPAPPSSTAEFLDLLDKSGIVSPKKFAAAVPDRAALPPSPTRAATILVQKNVLTRFQATQLLQGRHKGFKLGQYVLLDQVGRGGMGAVYLAEHQELRRKVAVKVLVPADGTDQTLATERFLREARAAAALDHPNIVRMHDVCRHGTVPYLVMDFVDGESLQQSIDRHGPFPHQVAAEIVAQAAAGLQHAHEHGFVHRDIKPANVMRDKGGLVKILDMGLARSFADPEHKLTEIMDRGAVVGTADFIAPEQAMSNAAVDIRADIYSLGATFFALVTGRPPFSGNTTQKLLCHQMKAAPTLLSVDDSIPPELSAVVERMMSKKAADRYATPAEVIAALAPWLANTTRVLAGLARTNVAEGSAIHAAVQGAAVRNGASSGRLTSVLAADDEAGIGGPAGPGSSVVYAHPDAGQGGMETMPDAPQARTKRTPVPAPRVPLVEPAVAPGRGKLLLLAAAAVGLMAAGALTSWLVFAR